MVRVGRLQYPLYSDAWGLNLWTDPVRLNVSGVFQAPVVFGVSIHHHFFDESNTLNTVTSRMLVTVWLL
jgi:hypothetical protein